LSNQRYRTIEEAIANAPVESLGAHYEINPLDLPETIREQLQAKVRLAVDAGLKVEIRASGRTLADTGMLHLLEFEGATINRDDSKDPLGYFHITVNRPVRYQAG